jgi:hypothetical protein
MKDIHGNALAEGDTVLVYAQRYERVREAGGVWVVDQTKPLPVADVPMARGRVAWDKDLLAWTVRFDWVCEAWQGKAAVQMGGGEYAFEAIQQVLPEGASAS